MAGPNVLSGTGWLPEDVPDADLLYRRIHRDHVDRGEPTFGAFRNDGQGQAAGMSTDWSKYALSQDTRSRGRKPAGEYGVVEMAAGDVRAMPAQQVVHEPDWPENRAHTNVTGPKSKKEGAPQEIRLRFLQTSRWAVQL